MATTIHDTGLVQTNGVCTWVSDTGSQGSTTHVVTSDRSMMVGETVPNYRKILKSGGLLPHTQFYQCVMSARKTTGYYRHDYDEKPTSTTLKHLYWQGTGYNGNSVAGVLWRLGDVPDGNLAVIVGPPGGIPDYFVQQAAARISASGFDGLTSLAELRKSVQMFRDIKARIIKLREKVTHKRAMQLWLEGRYGWRVLAYELRDFYDVLANYDEGRRLYSERAGTTITSSNSQVVGSGDTGVLTFDITKTETTTWSLRGAVSAVIKPAKMQFNPLVTAWELLPWSFVLDWVIDVGNALNSIQFEIAASSWTASKGYKCESTVTLTQSKTGIKTTGYTKPRFSVSGSCDCSYEYTATTQVRSPVNYIAKLPQFTNSALTLDKLLDLRALVQMRVR